MPDTFTPEQISQILEEFFKVVGTRQYIGARYVPIFGRKDEDTIEWDNTAPYEPLTIVLYQGNSYTSRQFVPVGVEITNQEFWAITGNYNAQVEMYRRETAAAKAAADAAQNDIDTLLPKDDFSADNTVKDYVDAIARNTALTIGDNFSPEHSISDFEDEIKYSALRSFDTVIDMQGATYLTEGMVCHTNGFHASGDGGAAYYIVSASGTANGMDVLACAGGLYATLVVTEPYVMPEQFGAYGDGTHDDTAVINAIISNNATIAFNNGAIYLTAPIVLTALNDVMLLGNDATLRIDNSQNSYNDTGCISVVNCSNVTIDGLKVTTTALASNNQNTDVTPLYTTGMFGVSIQHSTYITITNCDVSLVKDGISTEYSDHLVITSNVIYNCGQEPMAVRHSKYVRIIGNDCYWHLGDGILLKGYYSSEFWGTTISNNVLHDGKVGIITDIIGHTYYNMGGGVTCNAETITNGYVYNGLVVSSNQFLNTHYAVMIGNINNAIVNGNIANVGLVNNEYTQNGFGLELKSVNNITNAVFNNIVFSDNICVGGKLCYYAHLSNESAGITIENVVFENNIGCSDTNSEVIPEYGMYLTNCAVRNNTIYGTEKMGFFVSCYIVGNVFKNPTGTPSSPQTSDVYCIDDGTIIENNDFDITQMYVYSDDARILGNNMNSTATHPYIVTSKTSSGYILMKQNTLNGKPITVNDWTYGNYPYCVDADFWRQVSGGNGVTVFANCDWIRVVIDGANISSLEEITQITEPYFIPNNYRHMFGLIGTAPIRISYGPDGAITARASTVTSGSILLDTVMPK